MASEHANKRLLRACQQLLPTTSPGQSVGGIDRGGGDGPNSTTSTTTTTTQLTCLKSSARARVSPVGLDCLLCHFHHMSLARLACARATKQTSMNEMNIPITTTTTVASDYFIVTTICNESQSGHLASGIAHLLSLSRARA